MAETSPFSELPAALVEEVLAQSSDLGSQLLTSYQNLRRDRASYRESLSKQNLLMREADLGYPPIPTTCATDGSYAIERLLTVDLAAAAAVAMEGLAPPSEKRFWERPFHTTFIAAEIHDADTATVLRAVMLGEELILATKAPHDLVMIDGTLTLPVIYFNQAISQLNESRQLKCAESFLGKCVLFLNAYLEILQSPRSDKNFIALPKYSTRREFGRLLDWPGFHDDRGLFTFLLEPGELSKPVPLEQPQQKWHIYTSNLPSELLQTANDLASRCIDALEQVYVVYYKPHTWMPALRIEMARDVALNSYRLSSVIQGLKHQSASPAMLEPYPLYLADRTVKALARALPAFRQVATQQVAETYAGDVGEIYFAMHGYRTEMGT